jgi:small neutral amino acid transporter SnatA (MarC family)
LRQVGIPIRAFQISGGIVLFLVGLEMIRGHSYAGEEGTETAAKPRSRAPSTRSQSPSSLGPAPCSRWSC